MSSRRLLAGALLAVSAFLAPTATAHASTPPQGTDAPTCTQAQVESGKCARPDIWDWTTQGK